MKLLLTGASGFLGWHLCQQIPQDIEVHGVFYRQNYEHPQVHWHKCNLLEEADLTKLFEEIKPDAVLHAAAIANTNFCEEHPALSYHVNVYTTITLAQRCEQIGIPLLFISSDLVFNGNNPPYSEEDFPFPISRYGEQKLAAEEALLDDFKNTMVCRLPLLLGFGPEYSHSFFKTWIKALDEGETITAFTDEYRTALSAYDASIAVWAALNYLLTEESSEEKIRLFHLGAKESISRYDLAMLIADIFDVKNTPIKAVLRKDIQTLAARPENVSLDSDLAYKTLELNPNSLQDQLYFLKNKAKTK